MAKWNNASGPDAADVQLPFTPPSGIGTRRAIYADVRTDVRADEEISMRINTLK